MNRLRILLIVLVLILIWSFYSTLCLYSSFLEGLWTATEAFCKRAEIDGMMIFLGPSSCLKRKAYMLIYSENSVLASRNLELIFMPQFLPALRTSLFLSVSTQEEDSVLPSRLTAELYLAEGRMLWLDQENTVWFEAFRDNQASANSERV
jgi:hypothetical protein